MAYKKRDFDDPEFPHGTLSGYWQGCRRTLPCPASPACNDRYNEHKAAHKARKRRGEVFRYEVGAVRRYAESYLDKGWWRATFAAAAGMSEYGFQLLMTTAKTVKASTARRVLAVDEEALLRVRPRYVPAYLSRWKLGSMCAAGWTCTEQAKRLGYHHRTIARIVAGQHPLIPRELMEDIDVFFDQMRGTPCLSPHRASALRMAERYGFRRPEEYAPDGVLLEEEESRDAKSDKMAARWEARTVGARHRLEVLRLTVRFGMAPHEIMERLQNDLIDPDSDNPYRTALRYIARYRRESGLEFTGGHTTEIVSGQEERVARILDVLDRWEAAPLADPYPFVAELGMMTDKKWANVDLLGKPKLRAA